MNRKHAQAVLLLALTALLILPACSSTGSGNARDAAAEAGRDAQGSSEPGPEASRDSAVPADQAGVGDVARDTAAGPADEAPLTEVGSDQASDPIQSADAAEARPDAGAADGPADRGPSLPDSSLDQAGADTAFFADAVKDLALDTAGLDGGAADRPALDGGGVPSLAEICTSDGWCWANPLPDGLAIDGIDGTASDDYWAVGQSGIVLHFDGAGWQRIDAGVSKYLSCVRAFARDDVWIGGEAGLSHFDGTGWTVVDPGFSGWIATLAGTSSEDLWAATTDDSIGHRTAAGWSIVPSQASSASPWRMFSFSPSDAWAVGSSGYLRHWDGQQWTAVDGAYETYAVWGASPSDVWIGGNHGEMYHWNGQSLATTTFPTQWLTNDLWGSSASDVWAAVSYSPSTGQTLVHLLHYDGNQWNDVDPKSTPFKLHGSAADDIWAVGHGSLQHFDGASWSPRLSVTDDTLMGMWARSDNDAFAVDSAGRVLHWDGSHWSAKQTPATFLSSVTGTADDDVWVAGTSVLHFDGTAWTTVLANTGYLSSAAIWAAGRTDVWVGFDGPFFRHFNGTSFDSLASATGGVVLSIWGSGPSDVWAVGAGAQHWDGAKWTRVDTGSGSNELHALSGSASNNVWAAGDGGTVVRWNGLGWSAVTRPTTDDLYGIWVAGPNEVYVAVWSGQIWYWNGSTWTAQDSGVGDRPPFQLNGMAGAGSRIWAFGNNGILVTKRR